MYFQVSYENHLDDYLNTTKRYLNLFKKGQKVYELFCL